MDLAAGVLSYLVFFGVFAAIYAMTTLGLNLQWGFTGLFNAQPLGGPGLKTMAEVPHQLWVQFEGVACTLIWSGIVAVIGYFVADKLCGGLRVAPDMVREGLDMQSHGESAYHR